MTDDTAHNDYLALLESLWRQWPDMRRYADTAQRGGLRFDPASGKMIETLDVVTVTVFDRRTESHDSQSS